MLKPQKIQFAPYRTKEREKAFLIFRAAIQPFGHMPRRKKTYSPARKLFHTEHSKWTKQGRKGGEELMVLGFQYFNYCLHWHESVILPPSLNPTSDTAGMGGSSNWDLYLSLCVRFQSKQEQKEGKKGKRGKLSSQNPEEAAGCNRINLSKK